MYYKDHILRVLPLIRNKFIITVVVFVVWMIFFDKRNAFTQNKLNAGIDKLEQQKEEYIRKLVEVKQQKLDFEKNIEKFAREEHYLSKSNEQVYIIE